MATSEYRKTQDNNGILFEVSPASAAKSGYMRFMAVVFAAMAIIGTPAFGMVKEGWPLFYITFYILSALCYYLGSGKVDRRPRAHTAKATFRVTPTEIESNGRTFKKDDIHRFILKNAISNREIEAHEMLSLTNTGGTAGSLGNAAAAGFLAKVSAISNYLDLESGGKAYTLAGGMDETTAFGLLQDVSKAIGFKSS